MPQPLKTYDPAVPFCGESRDLGMGIKIRLMTVTPDVAEQWRGKAHPRNRNPSQKRVERYAADMTEGRFTLNDQAISFDTEGFMVNGGHRCSACVLSGKSFLSLVLYGLPHESFRNLDGVKSRSTDDNAKIAGIDAPRQVGATVRRMMMGPSNATSGITDEQVFSWLEKYGDSVRFAHRVLSKGSRVSNGVTRAVVARAHANREPEDRLERFGKVLLTGIMAHGEEAAVKLRNYVIEGDRKVNNQRSSYYGTVEIALRHFLDGVNKPLRLPDKELFPRHEDA